MPNTEVEASNGTTESETASKPNKDAGPEDVEKVGRLLRPVIVPLVGASLLRGIGAAAGVIPFLAVAWAGQALLESPVDRDGVWRAVWIGVIALVVSIAGTLSANLVTHIADVSYQSTLRQRMAERLGRVPLGWFGARTSGQVKKTLQDDVSAMHHLVAHATIDVVAAAVTPIVTIIVLFAVDWRLALFTLVPVIVGIGLYSRQMSGYGENMAAYEASLGRVNTAVVEFLNGIAVVKTFGQARQAHERYTTETESFADMFYDWVKGVLRLANITELVLSPLFAVLWILAGSTVFVANGWIEPADALPFLLLGAAVTAPINALGFAANEMQRALGAAKNVNRLLATPTLLEQDDLAEAADATVEYQGVGFSYDGEVDALVDIDLTLRPGTVTALVGPSGSGKTTIARLLPRFWDPTVGTVRIGGADVRELPLDRLYKMVGFVFQDVQLLRASIGENIALGRPDASEAEVTAAARAARIHDRIMELPKGYDSIAGVDVTLSGGEAQRVSIARMILADTPILVLDEATAFADPESEAEIQDALSQLAAGRTVLVIAHRLSTIVDADQIVVIDRSRVVDRGRHQELLDRCQQYQILWSAHGGALSDGELEEIG